MRGIGFLVVTLSSLVICSMPHYVLPVISLYVIITKTIQNLNMKTKQIEKQGASPCCHIISPPCKVKVMLLKMGHGTSRGRNPHW
ncbi:hypothetical protein FKM82_007556 [Ascaphus truei]